LAASRTRRAAFHFEKGRKRLRIRPFCFSVSSAMKLTRNAFSVYVGLMLFAGWPSAILAADLTLKITKKEPPKEVDESIRKTLQSTAVQLLDGEKAAFEFWLATEIPLASKPESDAKAMEAIKQSAIIGAVSVQADKRDYKDSEIPSGVYTLRFCLQPQDGNHLGTSEFLYFALLVSAKNDSKLDGLATYKSLARASSNGTANDHPIVLSLRPVSSVNDEVAKLDDSVPEHKCVRFKIPARVAGASEPSSLVFDLVYYGKGKT